MDKHPPIPRHVGPGSQPGEDPGELAILSMPSGIETFTQPTMPEPEAVTHLTLGLTVLEDILVALQRYRSSEPAKQIDLTGLDEQNLALVDQTLGEGEVGAVFAAPSPVKAQESVLAGVWRVRHFDRHRHVVHNSVEIGAAPAMVQDTFSRADLSLDTRFDAADPDIQNAPALLVELADRIATYQPGDPAHVINLTLLPLSDRDLALLGERLGVGPVTLLSRGYGNCRIGSTSKANTWWIKYYNSQDLLILNTIEVVDLPAVAMAAPEDIADSAARLDEMLALYR